MRKVPAPPRVGAYLRQRAYFTLDAISVSGAMAFLVDMIAPFGSGPLHHGIVNYHQAFVREVAGRPACQTSPFQGPNPVWFKAISSPLNQLLLLTIAPPGASMLREREQGTINT